MKKFKQYLKSAFYAFFTLAGMVFELPSIILYGIADYFYVAPDENNEEVDIANKLTINKLIDELNEQERDIVKLRYFNGKTQTAVAKKLGISQVQVSRIEKRILHSMKQKLVI